MTVDELRIVCHFNLPCVIDNYREVMITDADIYKNWILNVRAYSQIHFYNSKDDIDGHRNLALIRCPILDKLSNTKLFALVNNTCTM